MPTRTPIIAANWKMNHNPADAVAFAEAFASSGPFDGVEVVVSPSFVCLPATVEAFAKQDVRVAAQNCHFEASGAYTGEISLGMLQAVGAEAVILGHSERRSLFGEDDALINAKVKAVLDAGLMPIFCIGETLEERDGGQLESVLRTQITDGLAGVSATDLPKVVVAYEPVWAIGTGRTASAEQAQEAHAFVRSVLAELADQATADQVRIQYGGSVKPANAEELLGQADIDGALVGGAGLEAESFAGICQAAKA